MPLAIKYFSIITVGLLILSLLLIAFAYYLNFEAATFLFSEEGFFERMSPIAWCIAALYLLWQWRDHSIKYFILALTFFVFAGREIDMHKSFTSDSFLKINFYKDGIGFEQIFGGLAALVVIGLIISTFVIIVRDIIWRRGYKLFSGQLLLAGFTVLVLCKILDRAPSVLRKDYDIILGAQFDLILQALEEGFEFFGPVLILFAFIIRFTIENKNVKYLA